MKKNGSCVQRALRLALGVVAAGAWVLVSAAGTAPVKGDSGKGKKIAADVCSACHNPDGNSTISTNPKLAGQGAEYLVKELTDLAKEAGDKTGRQNPVMAGFAAMLSPADRLDVAAWFSQQTMVPDKPVNDEIARMGQSIFRAGVPVKAVPACAGCHGPAGAGLPVVYPRIGGQHADYVETQLKAFRDGSRHNSEAMMNIAFRLSDPEIKALATYVSGVRAQLP